MLPLFFLNVLHFDAMQTGVALLPGAIATALSMPIAGRLTKVLDPRLSIAGGLAMFAAGSWLMGGLNQYAGFWDIFWPRTIQGFALGFLFVPLTTTTLGEISRSAMANATGIFTLVRQLGGSVGIALLQVIELRKQDAASQALAANVTLANPAVAEMMRSATDQARALALLADSVAQNATVIGYTYSFQVCGLLFALAIPTVLLMRSPNQRVGAETPVQADVMIE
jgi:DHA2 family multidrug resistance protein